MDDRTSLTSCMTVLIGAVLMGCTNPESKAAQTDEASGLVVLRGTALAPDGRPLPDVEINAVLLSHRAKSHPLAGTTITTVVGRTTTDAHGSFQMGIRRTKSPEDIALELFAYTVGRGIGFQYLEVGEDEYDVRITLPEEIIIRAKLHDPNGAPLGGASVSLASLRSTVEGADNSYPFHLPPRDISAWPAPFESEEDGRFAIRGASSNTQLSLLLNDERTARKRWTTTVAGIAPSPLTVTTEAPRVVIGTVVAADQRTPIEGATVVITCYASRRFLDQSLSTTDANGNFTMEPVECDKLSIRVNSAGTKYHTLHREIPWLDGVTTQRMTLPLYHDGYVAVDGTTPDGRPASTIERDYPSVEVVHSRPAETLTTRLTGTILAGASITTADDPSTKTQGVIAVDPNTGAWRFLSHDALEPRVSPDGRHLLYVDQEQNLWLTAFGTRSEPRRIATNAIGPGVWAPTSNTIVVNVMAPARRDYQGEEYWAQESEKWRLNPAGEKLGVVSVPPLHNVHDISPDGRGVATHWDTHASVTASQLFAADIDGADPRPIARKRSQYYWYPRFSSDGTTVLAKHLDARDGSGTSIRTIALDGSHERSITLNDEYGSEVAAWSPDGNHIAVLAYINSAFTGGTKTSKLYIVDTEGSKIRDVILPNVKELFLYGDIDWTDAVPASR